MRLWRTRRSDVLIETAPPPPYSSQVDFVAHALNNPANGWYEPLYGRRSVGTVDRCLQLTAQTIANMPLRYKHDETTQGRRPQWLSTPDPAWYPNGIKEAIFAIVWSIYAHGDAFLWVTSRYEDGWPRMWTVLDAVTMHVEDIGGTRGYRSNRVWLDPRDVIQVSRNPNGALRGTGALEAYWSNVASAYQAEMYAADVYASSGVNRVALRSQTRLSAEQAAELQAQWVAAVSKRLGAPAILPKDLELLESLSISPKDLMLLESREWDARQIAGAFGIPAIKLNMSLTGGLTYQSPAMLNQQWWGDELMPRAGLIQEAFSERWLPRGNWVAFDPSRFLEPDRPTLNDMLRKDVAAGIITLDEARARGYDLPPLARGDQAAEYFEEPGAHGSERLAEISEEVLVP